MDLQLNGKKALVVAASKGIGKGVALALAREGCGVVITSSQPDNLKKAETEIRSATKGQVWTYTMDVSDQGNVQKISAQILKDHGRIDILVTNGPGPAMADADSVKDSALESAVQINLLSVIQLSRIFLPAMKQNHFGRIINLTSVTAKEPAVGMVLSNVTRAGVLAYAKTLAREVAGHGIPVNSILTGGVQTDRTVDLRKQNAKRQGLSYEGLEKEAAKNFPVGYIATPEQFSHAIAFLASPLSMYINGVSLPVDGGFLRGI